MLRQLKDPWHHRINRVCTRLPGFSSFISYGDHQHWRMLQQGNLGQCSFSLCPWALQCGCPELYSAEGSPWISCAVLRHVTLKYIPYYTIYCTIQYNGSIFGYFITFFLIQNGINSFKTDCRWLQSTAISRKQFGVHVCQVLIKIHPKLSSPE